MKTALTLLVLVLLTSASVAQWSEQTSGVTTTLYSVSVIDNNNVWICGAGGKVLRTTNGGINWQLTTSPNAALDLYNIWGIDATTAVVTGSSSTTYVYKTENGGANWTQVFSQTGGFINAINGLSLVNPNSIFMTGDPVGNRWSLWNSTDGGSTWDSTGMHIPQTGSETGYNNSIYIHRGSVAEARIWFGTNNTRIYTIIYSLGYDSQPTPGQANSLAVIFADSLIGFAGGSTGLLYTSNSGTIWSDLPGIPGSGSINGFSFTDNIGELFLSRGTSIYQTTNGGINWAAATTQTGTYTHMQGADARGNGDFNIWAIRNNGGISKYTFPIGIKPISSEVPNSFTLHQNYPNPFNPVTKIKFDIPKSAYTEIKIYDNLGREVYTLVSQEITAGKYEVEWNAVNYPSGVYYYKLNSDNYSETKKMVLIK